MGIDDVARFILAAMCILTSLTAVAVMLGVRRRELGRLRAALLEAIQGWEDCAHYKGDYLAAKHGDFEEAAALRRKHGLPPGPPIPEEVKAYTEARERYFDRAESEPCLDCLGPHEVRDECEGCAYHEQDKEDEPC
jgi:hypothetical protein